MSLEKRPEQLGEELLKAAGYGDRHTLERCLDGGANIDYQDFNGGTALYYAALKRNIDIVRLLIDGGINLNLQNKNGGTALYYAALKRNIDIVRLLIDGGINLNLQNKTGGTALHFAALNKNTEIVQLLIDGGCNLNLQNNIGLTALHNAATSGDTETAHLLIDNGININVQTNHGNTALHFAVWNGKTKVVYLLIDSGVDIHLQNRKGRTALYDAVKHDYIDIAKILIEYGCDTNLQDTYGNTMLHQAASNYNYKMVKHLLKKDSDPHLLNLKGETPIDLTIDDEIIRLLKDYGKTLLPGLPIEVKRFDKKSAKVFSSLFEEESYPHFESRVMLVGEQGTGKTTIARYLAGKRPSRFRIATDGIGLFNGLSYIDRQTKDWLYGRQDFSLEELAVSRSLLQEDKRKKNVSQIKTYNTKYIPDMRVDMSLSADKGKQKHQPIEPSSSDTTLKYDFDSVSSTKTFITEHVKTMSDHQLKIEPVHPGICRKDMQDINRGSERLSCRLIDDIQSSDCPSDRNEPEVHTYRTAVKENTDSINERKLFEAQHYTVLDDTCLKTRLKGDMHIQTLTKPGVISKLKNMFGVTKTVQEVKISITKENFLKKSINAGKRQLHNKMIAPIIIWDFGGHDVFYSTHQTFLTYRAIYMIVLDGSRTIDDPCQHEQFIPGKSGPKTARDYLRFWVNAIVTYCKGSFPGYPKIIVCLTHKDQVNSNEVEEIRHKLFADIKEMYQQTPIMNQLVIDDMIFVNAKDKHDTEMAKIKSTIIRETERQPTWGERLPKCFIPLELEFASLIKRNIPLITLDHLKKINAQQPIRPLNDSELKVFLKFQHSIGKVLYFDEHNLNNQVILSPTHLIDAFKSIVTDITFCEGDKRRGVLWDVMSKTGVISKKVIREVWKKKKYLKFYRDKEYLLDVMTHLDILVDPKRYDNDRKRIPADFYYIASMVRTNDDSGYLQSASFTHRSIAIAFQSSSLMIPPALSFRFISYCLYVWAVKKYGQTNKDMLFHRSAVFTVDPSLDLHILCEDERIIARLVHARTNSLIMRDLASSITECLTSALEKISQLYIRASSDQHHTSDASFITRICCNAPDNPCVLQINELPNIGDIWICPAHGIEHKIHIITSWFSGKNEDKCDAGCPVTNEDFLKVTPSDIHLRRMSLLYSRDNVRELAIRLGLSTTDVDNMLDTDDPRKWNFEVLRQCRNSVNMTFNHIKEAVEASGQDSIHRLCKLVKGGSIDFETQQEMWDLVPVDEHIDRLAPLVGNNSLPFLIELGMECQTWEQICYRQNERDLVRLNKDILEEWRNKFCTKHSLKPTLRTIAQALSYIGKSVKIVENTLSDLL